MRAAKVKYPASDQIKEGFLLESIEDVHRYSIYIEEKSFNVAKKVLKSPLPIEKADHLIRSFQGVEQGLMEMAVSRSKSTRKNLIYCFDDAHSKYLAGLLKNIRKGTLFINPNGGYCPLQHLEVVELGEEIGELREPKVFLKDESKYLILENDLDLETKAIEICSREFDQNFSYIVDLRSISSEELRRHFTKFVKLGGIGLYVYTTAWDLEQLYQYSQIAIQSGIKILAFTFPAGINEKTEAALKWLNSNKSVKVVLKHLNK